MEKRTVSVLSVKQRKTQDFTNVPLNEQAEQVLKERKRMAENEHASPFVFPFLVESDPAKRDKYSFVAHQMKRWGKQAGIDQRLHFHLARHTFATLAITYGSDLFTVSKLLGHSSFQSTLIYAHVLNAPKLEAMDRLSKARGFKSGSSESPATV